MKGLKTRAAFNESIQGRQETNVVEDEIKSAGWWPRRRISKKNEEVSEEKRRTE